MPSISKKQQRLMGMAYSYAKGEMPEASKSVKKLAKSFLKKDKDKGLKNLKDFASTKQNSLPEKISENHILRFSEI